MKTRSDDITEDKSYLIGTFSQIFTSYFQAGWIYIGGDFGMFGLGFSPNLPSEAP